MGFLQQYRLLGWGANTKILRVFMARKRIERVDPSHSLLGKEFPTAAFHKTLESSVIMNFLPSQSEKPTYLRLYRENNNRVIANDHRPIDNQRDLIAGVFVNPGNKRYKKRVISHH